MLSKTATKKNTLNLLQGLLEEIRAMRRDLALIVPQENLKDYAHPKRIETALRNALRTYPRRSV